MYICCELLHVPLFSLLLCSVGCWTRFLPLPQYGNVSAFTQKGEMGERGQEASFSKMVA